MQENYQINLIDSNAVIYKIFFRSHYENPLFYSRETYLYQLFN